MITNPDPGVCFLPTANAHTADMFRVKKYLPPGRKESPHASRSEILLVVVVVVETFLGVVSG